VKVGKRVSEKPRGGEIIHRGEEHAKGGMPEPLPEVKQQKILDIQGSDNNLIRPSVRTGKKRLQNYMKVSKKVIRATN